MLSDEDKAPHNLEPSFRKLGVPTKLIRGVPTIDEPFTVCQAGDKLKADQVNILKILGRMLATVRAILKPPSEQLFDNSCRTVSSSTSRLFELADWVALGLCIMTIASSHNPQRS